MSERPFENFSTTKEVYDQWPAWGQILMHTLDRVSGFVQHPVESIVGGLGYAGLAFVTIQLGIYLFDPKMRYLYTTETYESGKSLALWSIAFLTAASIMKIARNSGK